jgi:Basic region leucine zipper
MSQRKHAVGPSSDSTDGSQNEAPTTESNNSATGHQAVSTERLHREGSKLLERAPTSSFDQNAAVGPLDQKPSRPLDVNRILNPTPLGELEPKNLRRSAAHLDSPPSSGTTSHHAAGVLPPSPNTDPNPGTPSSAQAHSGSLSRRMLTPRSPGLRAASMGRPSITGMMNAQQSPFVGRSGRTYSIDVSASGASETQPVPTPPVVQPPQSVSSYGLPPAAPTPPIPSRRESSVALQSAQSQAASPSTSYSSYSQPSYTSPASHFRPLVSQELQQPYPPPSQFSSRGIQHGGGRSTGSPSESGFSSAPGAWQQNKYQLYFSSGEQGTIPVPVDIHAASKQADEKRKRNAGASARFRARRKEKEREASHTIAKLEQQIRDLIEERDFYHTERDYFRSVLYSVPQQGPLPPRPVSPRLRRPVAQVQYTPVQATSGGPWAEDQGEDVTRRHTRRRTNAVPSDLMSHPPDAKVSLGGSPSGYTLAPAASEQRIELTYGDSNSIPRSAPYNPFPDTYDQGRHGRHDDR